MANKYKEILRMSQCPINDRRIQRLFGAGAEAGAGTGFGARAGAGAGTSSGRQHSRMGQLMAASATVPSSVPSQAPPPPVLESNGGIRNRTFAGTGQAYTPESRSRRSGFSLTHQQISEMDLNIDNYTLDDLLRLYGLPAAFNEDDLKRAYHQTLMTHPDKSAYPKEVFLFFTKAFRTIKSVYEFRSKQNRRTADMDNYDNVAAGSDHRDYSGLSATKHKELVKDLIERKDFNTWFNETFEKTRMKNEFVDTGYDEWFRGGDSEGVGVGVGAGAAATSTRMERNLTAPVMPQVYRADDISTDFAGVNGSKDRMNEVFERRRREARALIVYNKISETGLGAFGGGISASLIDGSKPEDYSSEMFSGLQYEDLHKAHTETVVPVSEEEDFHARPKFASVDEYNRYREANNVKAMSKEEAEAYLMKQYEEDTQDSNHRAMRLIQQEKDAIERMKEVWGSALRLTNN